MDVIFFILLIIAIAILSIPFGRDSRGLGDHDWERDGHGTGYERFRH